MSYKYPDVVNQMRVYWLEGQCGGQLLNGHYGYREIAPESTGLLLLLEFEEYLPFLIACDFYITRPEMLN